MLNSGPSGFQNAPFSKALLLVAAAFSIGSSVLKVQHLFDFPNIGSVLSKFEIWRLVTSHFFFASPGELLFGLLLMYYFRLFERQMGTVKFGSFACISVGLSTMAQVAIYVILPSIKFTSGPYSFLFACLVLFFADVPATHRFRLCGISATDKLFVYILVLQLFFSNSPQSIFSSICGILGGLAYKSDTLGLNRRKFPLFLTQFCSRFILPFLESPSRPSIQRTPIPIPPIDRAIPFTAPFSQAPTQGYSDQLIPNYPIPQVQPPSDESIDLLTGMGFPRQAVVDALIRCNNNVEMATHILLDQN